MATHLLCASCHTRGFAALPVEPITDSVSEFQSVQSE